MNRLSLILMRVDYFIAAMCCLLFIGCADTVQTKNAQGSDQAKMEHITKKKYNAEGNVISIQEFLKNDTGLLADGPFTDYFYDGTVKSTGAYKMGKFNGFVKNYNSSGVMIQKLYLISDSMIGGQYDYYDNGIPKLFEFYLSNNGRRFAIYYDKKGNVIKELIEGKPLALIVLNNKPVYDSIDTVNINVMFAKPDRTKTKLSFRVVNNNNKTYNEELTDKDYDDFVFANTYYYRFPYFADLGSSKFTATLRLYDSVTNKLITTDSVKYDIIVNP